MKEKPQSAPSGFEQFWLAYPRRAGKGLAVKIWNRLKVKQELLNTILAAIAEQKTCQQWQRNNGQFIPYPSTWLAQKRWEDEPDNVGAGSQPSSLPSAAEVRRVIREHRERMRGLREADKEALWEKIFQSELQCSFQTAMKAIQEPVLGKEPF